MPPTVTQRMSPIWIAQRKIEFGAFLHLYHIHHLLHILQLLHLLELLNILHFLKLLHQLVVGSLTEGAWRVWGTVPRSEHIFSIFKVFRKRFLYFL